MAALFKSRTTYDPIFSLLNAEEKDERDSLTKEWIDHKLQELNFIGIVGALIAGCLTSTGSWPDILEDGTPQPWTVRACWYIGIVLALASVLIAAQQSVRLHRLCTHRNAYDKVRRLLSHRHRCPRTGYALPRNGLVYTWQLSVLFLTLSVLAMITGIFILIWSSTGNNDPDEGWWNSQAKLAVAFTVVFIAVAGLFVFEQLELYSWYGEDDSDEDRRAMERYTDEQEE